MANDASPYVRPAVLTLLKGAVPVTVLVPAARIYPQQRPPNPAWPFIGYGAPIVVPFGASGLDGSSTTVAIHAYAETTGEGDDTVSGEDMAAAINRVVAAVLGGEDGCEIDLTEYGCPFPAVAHISWTGSQVVQDNADASAFHGFSSYAITVSS